MTDKIIYNRDRCPYEQQCRELPLDMSCKDVQKYVKAKEEPPKMEDSE